MALSLQWAKAGDVTLLNYSPPFNQGFQLNLVGSQLTQFALIDRVPSDCYLIGRSYLTTDTSTDKTVGASKTSLYLLLPQVLIS